MGQSIVFENMYCLFFVQLSCEDVVFFFNFFFTFVFAIGLMITLLQARIRHQTIRLNPSQSIWPFSGLYLASFPLNLNCWFGPPCFGQRIMGAPGERLPDSTSHTLSSTWVWMKHSSLMANLWLGPPWWLHPINSGPTEPFISATSPVLFRKIPLVRASS